MLINWVNIILVKSYLHSAQVFLPWYEINRIERKIDLAAFFFKLKVENTFSFQQRFWMVHPTSYAFKKFNLSPFFYTIIW